MFFDTELMKKTIKRAEDKDLTYAINKLFKDIGVFSISQKGNAPKKGPLLIISNHTGIFDSLLILSKINRNDNYFIALSTYEIFGSKIKKKLLPIFRARSINHKIYEYPLCMQVNKKLPIDLSKEEIQLRNRETIRKAASLIDTNCAVSIFPTGSAGKSLKGSSWKVGVGFLVKQITNPYAQVVFVQIQGTRQSDIVAYLHPLLRKLLFKPQPISIRFSEAYLLTQLINKESDAKTITNQLKKLYSDQWN